jgi:hypothetical protein
MTFASVHDMKPAAPHRRKHSRDRRDRRAGQRQIVPHPVDIAANPTKIDLHIDDDESRILGPHIPIEGQGYGSAVTYRSAIALSIFLTLDPNTSNAVPMSGV